MMDDYEIDEFDLPPSRSNYFSTLTLDDILVDNYEYDVPEDSEQEYIISRSDDIDKGKIALDWTAGAIILSQYPKNKPSDVKSLFKLANLPLIKGCKRGHILNNEQTSSVIDPIPIMPLLKLRFEQSGISYTEPVRDRDKNWVLHSQRQALDAPLVSPRKLGLGKYDEEEMSPLEWMSPLQSLLRKKYLTMQGIMISDTLCVVNIIGIGISGRLVSTNTKSKRIIVIEAYSYWNSTTYSLQLSISKLKYLFHRRSDLLDPGRKRDLLNELLRLLYFEYTIVLPPLPPQRMIEKEVEKDVRILKTSHLEDPHIPQGYPSSIVEIMRVHTDGQPGDDITVPELFQKLCISDKVRETGATKRRRDEAERLRREREEEERRRRAYLAIPKRIRGRVVAECIRAHGKIFIIEIYRFPNRPTIASVRGLATKECTKLTLSLVLNTISRFYKVTQNPRLWTDQTAKEVCSSVMKEICVRGEHIPKFELHLAMRDRKGATTAMHPLASVSSWGEGRVPIRRKNLVQLDTVTTGYFVFSRSFTAHGMRSQREHRGMRDPVAPPRRYVGRGRRMCSRVLRVGGARGTFTLYCRFEQQNKKKRSRSGESSASSDAAEEALEGGVEEAPADPIEPAAPRAKADTKSSGDRKVESKGVTEFSKNVSLQNDYQTERKIHPIESVALGLLVDIDAYFPYSTPILGCDLPANSLHRVTFDRFDVMRLVDDVDIMFTALKSLNFEFYDNATEEDITQSENAWDEILCRIIRNARWAITSYQSAEEKKKSLLAKKTKMGIKPSSYVEKLEDVEKLLYFDSCPIVNEMGGQVAPGFEFRPGPPLPETPRSTKSVEDDVADFVTDSESESGSDMGHNSEENAPAEAEATKIEEIPADTPVSDRIENAPPPSTKSFTTVSAIETKLCLRWSAVVLSKVQKLSSDTASRPSPTFQVVMWQRGQTLGVIGYDHQKRDIYSARPNWKTQKIFLTEIQSLSRQERVVNAIVFLADLEYYEIITGVVQGAMRFADNYSLRMDVVDKDYKKRTDIATNQAAEAARARTKISSALMDTKPDIVIDAENRFRDKAVPKESTSFNENEFDDLDDD